MRYLAIVLLTISTAFGQADNTIVINSFSTDYFMEVALGKIPGQSSINKFGRNTEVDLNVIADVWDGGKTVGALPAGTSLLWVAPTAAAVHGITSTSDDDTIGGVGARTVKLWGLPTWNTKEANETIILRGGDTVNTTNSYVIIYRMQVMTKGATIINAGTITATATAPSATTITARIEVGQGSTHMAIVGIPSVQTAYAIRMYANYNRAVGSTGIADISLEYNPEPDVELTNFVTNHTLGLVGAGTSAMTITFGTPKKFVGPGILKIQIVAGVNNSDVSAGFDIILVDN